MNQSLLSLFALLTFCKLAVAHPPPTEPDYSSAYPSCPSSYRGLADQHPDRYEVNDGRFYVSAEVMPNENNYLGNPVPGQRTIELNFHLKTKKTRSKTLRGKEEFQNILQHFDGRFDQIMGNWVKPTGRDLNDNMDAINSLTGGPNPIPLKEAALQTWTGQQASAAGYTVVKVIKTAGRPGSYKQVKVVFQKPGFEQQSAQ